MTFSREKAESYASLRTTVIGGDGCWLWTGSFSNGRPFAYLPRSIDARRLLLCLRTGIDAKGRHITPSCGDRSCVRPDHQVLSHAPSPKRKARALPRVTSEAYGRGAIREGELGDARDMPAVNVYKEENARMVEAHLRRYNAASRDDLASFFRVPDEVLDGILAAGFRMGILCRDGEEIGSYSATMR